MQSVSSRIWTRVAVSISYDDNDYTTGTSKRSLLVVLDYGRQLYLLTFIYVYLHVLDSTENTVKF